LENAEAIKPVINLALEISKQNNIGKTILNSRFKILRNIFPAGSGKWHHSTALIEH
jgi:hypothetical protein